MSVRAPQYYAPGALFSITVHIEEEAPGRNNWGFEIASRFLDGGQAGAWLPGQGIEVRTNAAGIQYASHSSAPARPGTSWNFQLLWTAPPDTVNGQVFFDVAALAGDGSGDITGDHVFTARTIADGITTPAINSGGIINAASRVTNMAAPGSLVVIEGVNFSGHTELAAQLPLPTVLAGTSVLQGGASGGLPVPLLFVSPQRIYAQIPVNWGTPGTLSLVVKPPVGASSPPQSVNVQRYAPAIFTVDGSGYGAGIIQHSDYRLVTDGLPARAGEAVLVYCSGLGLTHYPQLESGRAGAGQEVLVRPTVTVGGQPATVTSATAVKGFVGLYQVNFEVPVLPEGAHEILLDSSGFKSAPGVTIAVGPSS